MTRRLLALVLLVFTSACAGPAPAPSVPGPVPPPGPAEGPGAYPAGDPFDYLIQGGRIVDGTGAPWILGDLAIRGDRIVAMAPPGGLDHHPIRERIDARGMVVSPGFIDIMSHSLGAFLNGDSRVVSKVTQGITTEILGEGTTPAPVNDAMIAARTSTTPQFLELLQSFRGERGFDRWLRVMEERGVSANVGSFMGAATLRTYAKGTAMGPPTPAELDTMRAITRRGMEDGAFGVASALIYPPGSFAGTEELVEIARAMAPYGGVYITHMRSEADEILEAMDEALRIGQEGGVPVEIYHLKVAGRRNWPKIDQVIEKIDSARGAGLDVQANMYPYVAGGTGLSACFPPWASADGALFSNLRDPEVRARMKEEILQEVTDWENLCQLTTPEGVLLMGLNREEHEQWRGRSLAQVADEMGLHWVDAAMDLVLAEGQRIGSIYFMMSEENVRRQFQQPWIKWSTDAGGMDPDSAQGLAHPRAYGSYPRILGMYVREEGVISLEEAVQKATSAVARRLFLEGRGVLGEGYFADVVVFDPEMIRDRATFEDPHQLSVGVEHVFVNGIPVVREGVHTGAKPGRVLRGPGYRGWQKEKGMNP
jgi:N-acyl-D-amino-acid deacylase